mmetsp:Transcript_19097/g.62239  ORF Transcript_19097/g.62239 Transcript_19097/m.62239 type:complete len:187 (-) Transcript_19097:327-887(-)
MKTAAALMLAWVAAAVAKCPGSSAWIHASCEVEVIAMASCTDVKAEMLARVNGQYAKWHDPHNNGTYSVLSFGDGLMLKRVTGNKMYTDRMGFDFKVKGAETCVVSGCSESQVTSVADFSTNYCNLRMMLCGSKEGCHPVEHDFGIQESSVKPSLGASHDPSACIKVAAQVVPAVTWETDAKTINI